MASVVALSPIFVSEGRGKLAIGLKYLWILATWLCTHGGVAILAVYINYICAIVVLLAYSHKYRARINNRLYGMWVLGGAHSGSPQVHTLAQFGNQNRSKDVIGGMFDCIHCVLYVTR